MSQSQTFTQDFAAPVAQVYQAFTNPIYLRQWLCNYAYINRFHGNAYLFTWNIGYIASGRYTLLKPNEKLSFTWFSDDDPGVTTVEVTLTASETGCLVVLEHGGFGEGAAWDALVPNIVTGWRDGFEHLAYFLETGQDLRIARRPMMGINTSVFTEDLMAKHGFPVREGVLVTSTLSGLGAHAAGLQGNDLIVSINDKPVNDYGTLVGAIIGKHGGDTVPVQFYRGSILHTVEMTLSKRVMPDVPASFGALAESLQADNAALGGALDSLLADVTDEQAAQHPAPDVWSVNDNLAHLIFAERFNQMTVWGLCAGDDTFVWPDNNPAQLTPILFAYPTKTALVMALKEALAATAATVAAIPAEHDNAILRTIANQSTRSDAHIREHFEQITETLAALQGVAS